MIETLNVDAVYPAGRGNIEDFSADQSRFIEKVAGPLPGGGAPKQPETAPRDEWKES